MNCLALDDEPLALQLLNTYINRLPVLLPQGFFSNPDKALNRLLQGDIDLLFLDIQMPDINGFQFLRKLEHPPLVIFTTAFSEFAVEGFNLDAIDYLLKPFDYQRFEKAIWKAVDYRKFLDSLDNKQEGQLPNAALNSLFVKVEYSVVQIPFNNILYIEAFDDYIKIHTGAKPVLTLMSLKNALEALPANRFCRVHRSFIVALDKIERLKAQKINIAGRDIPVGATFKQKLKQALST